MELTILLLVAAGLFLVMAVCVATMSPNGLSMGVASILLVQHFSLVGKLAGQQVPSSLSWVSAMFSVISMLNFDVQFVKPGCVVADLSFLTVYWVTWLIMLLTSAMFTIASLIKAKPWQRSNGMRERPSSRRLSDEEEVSQSVSVDSAEALKSSSPSPSVAELPWRWRFRARWTHAHLILGSILYLRVTTMNLQALDCTEVQEEQGSPVVSVLLIDLTTLCYQGNHLITAIALIWPSVLFFCVGFPIVSAVLLYRNFTRAAKVAARGSGGMVEMSSQKNHQWRLLQSPRSTSRKIQPYSPPQLLRSSRDAHAQPGSPLSQYNSLSSSTRSEVQHSRAEAENGEGFTPSAAASEGKEEGVVEMSIVRCHPHRQQRTKAQEGGHRSTSSYDSSSQSNGDLIDREWSMRKVEGVAQSSREDEEKKAEASQLRSSSHPRAQQSLVLMKLREFGRDEKRQEQMGYLIRQLKGEKFYFRLLFLCTSFAFGCVSVLPSSFPLRLCLTGVCFLLDVLLVGVMLPFESWKRNLLSAVMSLVGVVQCLASLALIQLGLQSSTSDTPTLDLGHSASSQQTVDAPSSSLTGQNDVAAELAIALTGTAFGIATAIALVHRKVIARAAKRAWKRFSRWVMRGWTRLCTVVIWTVTRLYRGCVRAYEVVRGGWLWVCAMLTALTGWCWSVFEWCHCYLRDRQSLHSVQSVDRRQCRRDSMMGDVLLYPTTVELLPVGSHSASEEEPIPLPNTTSRLSVLLATRPNPLSDSMEQLDLEVVKRAISPEGEDRGCDIDDVTDHSSEDLELSPPVAPLRTISSLTRPLSLERKGREIKLLRPIVSFARQGDGRSGQPRRMKSPPQQHLSREWTDRSLVTSDLPSCPVSPGSQGPSPAGPSDSFEMTPTSPVVRRSPTTFKPQVKREITSHAHRLGKTISRDFTH